MSDSLQKLTLDDIRALSSEDLDAKLFELSVALQESRFKNSIRQLENTALISVYRKKIAQIKTVLQQQAKAA